MTSAAKAILVIGAGESTGAAVARRFAREGFIACVARRNGEKLAPLVAEIEAAGGHAIPYGTDARKEEQVVALVDQIEREVAPLEVAVFNVGANVKFGIRDTTARVYFKVWEMACFGGFLMGREVSKRMAERGRGTIIYTGATASVRGAAGFSAFAGAEHAKRALAQSMARELGPLGIHVAHVVIDGPIDTPWIHENMADMIAQRPDVDGMLEPDAIAETYWQIHRQPKNAWTWEMDLRPWAEPW